jgi:hypothetical protein
MLSHKQVIYFYIVKLKIHGKMLNKYQYILLQANIIAWYEASKECLKMRRVIH